MGEPISSKKSWLSSCPEVKHENDDDNDAWEKKKKVFGFVSLSHHIKICRGNQILFFFIKPLAQILHLRIKHGLKYLDS